jgi:hypothetical protein
MYLEYTPEGLAHILVPLALSRRTAELFELYLNAEGIPLSGSLRKLLQTEAAAMEAEVRGQLRSKGVPHKLKRLFEFTGRAEVKSYCRELTVYPEDLAYLICNCGEAGYLHSLVEPDGVPPAMRARLECTLQDFLKYQAGKGRNVHKRIQQSLRRRLSTAARSGRPVGHLFERGNEWHWFCLPTSWHRFDLERHWAGRPRMEYLSHLWGKLERDELGRRLAAVRPTRRDGAYIQLALKGRKAT